MPRLQHQLLQRPRLRHHHHREKKQGFEVAECRGATPHLQARDDRTSAEPSLLDCACRKNTQLRLASWRLSPFPFSRLCRIAVFLHDSKTHLSLTFSKTHPSLSSPFYGHCSSPNSSMSPRGIFSKTHLPRLCRIAVFLIHTNVSLFRIISPKGVAVFTSTCLRLLGPPPDVHLLSLLSFFVFLCLSVCIALKLLKRS